ncbi:MAG: choice-of-anchor D domain-containing protein [bacterium]
MCRIYIFATVLFLSTPLFGQGSWSPFVNSINGKPLNGAAFLNERYGFASTSDGTFRTTDSGKTWIHTGLGSGIGKYQFYFYTPSNIFFNGELESVDSGMTWKALPNPTEEQLYIKNGIFFDASGRVSFNHTRTWQIIDTNFKSGEAVTGNLENDIAIWGGSAFGNPVTLFTTDLGRSWHYGAAGVESDFGYAIPFTHTFFRAGGDGTDAIERSYTSGATWDTILGPIQWQYLSDGLAGNGCVIYAQTMDTTFRYAYGLIRSTDQGGSWQYITGPVARDDYPITGVMSRGAVCMAMSHHFGEPLYKYIDSSLLRPVLWEATITTSFADTLYLNECDSMKIRLGLSYSACDFIRWHDMRVDSLPQNNYRLSYKAGNIIRTDHPDSAFITLLPNQAGIYPLRIHIGVSASDWSGSDTTLSFVLVVKSNPAVLTIDKADTLNFGALSFCNATSSQDIHISNLSCHSLKVTRIKLIMDSSAQYDFSASMNPPVLNLKEGIGTGKITVKMVPQSPGIKSGRLIIFTSIGNDTIRIYANVMAPPKSIVTRCDTIISPLCGSSDGFMHLTNSSCRFMTLDSLTLPSGFELLPTRFPVYIISGGTVDIPLRFTPANRGESVGAIHASLSFFMPNGAEQFDTTIRISGMGTHGPSAYSLTTNQIQFNPLHVCDSPEEQHIVLYSTGCDTLSLASISLSGDADFSLSENGKRVVAVGDSVVMDVRIDPVVKGNKSAMITITKSDSLKENIYLGATVSRAVRTLSNNNPALLDFGATYTCQTNDTSVRLHNQSCDTIIISGVRWQVSGISGLGFGVLDSFPIIIPPGGDGTITIETVLDTIGGAQVNTASLEILSNADNPVPPITITRSYLYSRPIHLWLDADQIPKSAPSVWYVKLKGNPSEFSGINTLDFHLSYNSDMLEFMPAQSTAINTSANSFSIGNSPITIGSDSSLAYLQFQVYVAKDTSTVVGMSNVVLNSLDPQFTSCVAYPSVLGNGVTFTAQTICGDPLIRKLLSGAKDQFFVRTNPVRDNVLIDAVNNSFSEKNRVEIFNALGVKVYSEEREFVKGAQLIQIATHTLESGIYYLHIQSGSVSSTSSFLKMR